MRRSGARGPDRAARRSRSRSRPGRGRGDARPPGGHPPRRTRRGEGERRSQPSPRRRTSPTARGSGARRPAARTTGVLRRTAPTRGRGPDRAGRGRESQPLHELLQALGAAGGHYERVAVGPHDHHILQADHGDVLALGPDHRAAHVFRHRRLPDHHVAVCVRLANAQQGVPGADVVPAERPGNDCEPFGPLQHGHVHRHGPDGGEEARDVARRERGPAGLELARVGARFAQEAGHAPREQPRVPERALAAQQRRAGGVWLLEEAPHGARTAGRLRRDDVPVAGLVARRLHAHGGEHVVLGRHTERLAPGVAAEYDVLATVGVKPTRNETGYGYIIPAKPPGGARTVRRFLEKPYTARAALLRRQGALWNTGLFAWGVARFLGEAGAYARELKPGWPALTAGDVAGFFAAVRPVAVDVAVLERTKRLAVVAGTFGWDDIGSWDALLRIRKPDAHGNVVVGKATVADDVRRSVIWSENEHVAVVGLEDMVVVRANGHTLVMPTGRADRLKELVQRL